MPQHFAQAVPKVEIEETILDLTPMAEIPTPPRRRWFQFGIGTMLLLVTVFAVWLSWELNYVRHRKACVAKVSAVGQVVSCATNQEWAKQSGTVHEPFRIPWWRRLMGDE